MLALDKTLEDCIEHVISRQRILIGLVVAQLGRRRPIDHDRWNDPARLLDAFALAIGLRIAPARERKNLGLVDILERRITTAHVAVNRRVSDGHLALVTRRQQHATELVRQRHQHHAPTARLQVFFGGIKRTLGKHRRQSLQKCLEARLDRQHLIIHTERMRLRSGLVQTQLRGIARRQHHRGDTLGTDRIDGDRHGQRRIDATGQAQQYTRKVVLRDVVACATHEGGIDPRGARRRDILRPVLRAEAARDAVVIGDEQGIGEGRGACADRAIGIDQQRAAVEQQIILPADQIQVGDRDSVFACATDQQLVALCGFFGIKRRGVDHQQQLGTVRHGLCRGFDFPDVFANQQADAHAANFANTRRVARAEIAFFVEHRVIR